MPRASSWSYTASNAAGRWSLSSSATNGVGFGISALSITISKCAIYITNQYFTNHSLCLFAVTKKPNSYWFGLLLPLSLLPLSLLPPSLLPLSLAQRRCPNIIISPYRPWDGSALQVGTMYSYDIFAAEPCCVRRLQCKNCGKVAVESGQNLPFYSQFRYVGRTCSAAVFCL